MTDEELVFNGVDATTGGYLFAPMPLDSFAALARDEQPTQRHVRQLVKRHDSEEASLGLMHPFSDDELASAGWAIVTAQDVDPAVLEALTPLRRLREQQAGERYRELVVLPDEDDDAFLARHSMGPGLADPRKVPYYILLVGDPDSIPYRFQWQLDVNYAVGRLHFDTPAEYASYADSVVTAEAGEPGPATARSVHLFGTRNPGDVATSLSAARLVVPLVDELAELGPGVIATQDIGETAVRERLVELLTGSDVAPVLFTATHGLGSTEEDQRETQGALVCQEWPGPLLHRGPVDESHYVAAAHVPSDQPIRPRVVFSFACFGAGTPDESDVGTNPALARQAFVGRLPQRLLGSPAGGALAFVGHVDRAFSYSFLWKGSDPQIGAFASALLALLDGVRVGAAMESMGSRYATIATQLTSRLQAERASGKVLDDNTFASLWTANHDARSYIVLGDPAVRALPAR